MSPCNLLLTKSALRLALLSVSLAAAASSPAQPSRPAAAPTATAAASNPEAENAGKLAAHAWLALLDRRDWGTAWDASATGFRQSVPLGNWMDAVPKVRQPYGAFVEREAMEAIYKNAMPGRPPGDYVSVMFASKFEKQAVQEVVTTVREPDGRWRVIGYSPTAR